MARLAVCVYMCVCVHSCASKIVSTCTLNVFCPSQFFNVFLLQVLDYAIEADQLIDKYETLASELLQWIEQTIVTLNDRQLANSLSAVQNQLQAFNSYRTVEKPPK